MNMINDLEKFIVLQQTTKEVMTKGYSTCRVTQ